VQVTAGAVVVQLEHAAALHDDVHAAQTAVETQPPRRVQVQDAVGGAVQPQFLQHRTEQVHGASLGTAVAGRTTKKPRRMRMDHPPGGS
jgi:hypothetical protein